MMKKWLLPVMISLALLTVAVYPASAAPTFDEKHGPQGGSKYLENPGAAQKGYRPESGEDKTEGNQQEEDKEKEKPRLAFPVISDIHVQSWHTESHQKFAAALQDLNRVNPQSDTLVLNGDLTNGMPSDYAKLAELMNANPHSKNVQYTIGNHEFYKAWFDSNGWWNAAAFPNGETELASINRFLKLTGEKHVYYDRMVKGYHFIFLGAEQYRQSDPANLEDAYLSQEQLDWLKKTLKKGADSEKPVFVFLHQPLPYTVAGTHFCCTNNRAVVQHEQLKKILSDYPQVIYFSGHSHWELKLPNTLVRDKFTMVNSSAVIQPWTDDGNGGEMLAGPNDSEGLYVEVYKDKVKIKGRDFYRQRWIPEAEFTVPTVKLETD